MLLSGWGIIAWCAACGSGAILFLSLVAAAIERAERVLRLSEQNEQKGWKQGQEGDIINAQVVDEAA